MQAEAEALLIGSYLKDSKNSLSRSRRCVKCAKRAAIRGVSSPPPPSSSPSSPSPLAPVARRTPLRLRSYFCAIQPRRSRGCAEDRKVEFPRCMLRSSCVRGARIARSRCCTAASPGVGGGGGDVSENDSGRGRCETRTRSLHHRVSGVHEVADVRKHTSVVAVAETTADSLARCPLLTWRGGYTCDAIQGE